MWLSQPTPEIAVFAPHTFYIPIIDLCSGNDQHMEKYTTHDDLKVFGVQVNTFPNEMMQHIMLTKKT